MRRRRTVRVLLSRSKDEIEIVEMPGGYLLEPEETRRQEEDHQKGQKGR